MSVLVVASVWHLLQNKTVISEAYRSPESDTRLVMTEDVESDSLVLGKNFGNQHLNALPANTLSPMRALNEKMAQVDMVSFFAVKRIGDNTGIIFKNGGLVAAG